MSERTTTRMSLKEAFRRKDEDQTDWERLRREREQGIEPVIDPDEGDFDRLVEGPSSDAVAKDTYFGALE